METANMSTSTDNGEMEFRLEFGNITLEDIWYNYDIVPLNTTLVTSGNDYEDILKEQPWKIGAIVIYSIVILCGFVENATIIGIFIKNKHLHVPINIFIAVLALSDILLCSFNLPLQLHQQLTDTWIFGGTMCKIFILSYGIPVFMSSMSILLIAVDRYCLIIHPHRPRMSTRTALGSITGTAVFGTLLIIPDIVQTEYMVINVPDLGIYVTFCMEKWSNAELRLQYTIVTILLQFFVPLFATSCLYIQSGLTLNRNNRNHNQEKKTNNILIAIAITYLLCWLPLKVFGILLEFNDNLIPIHYLNLIYSILRIVATLSACINPFLYGWLNYNFRQHLPQ